jgi:hypothetical protein
MRARSGRRRAVGAEVTTELSRMVAATRERRARLWSGRYKSSDLEVVPARAYRGRPKPMDVRQIPAPLIIAFLWPRNHLWKNCQLYTPEKSDVSVEFRDFVPSYPPIAKIIAIVARHYAVTARDIKSERRTADIVRPRQVVMYLAKTLTLRSLPYIGHHLGGKDHTTVLHGVRKITRLVAEDPALAAEIEALAAEIRAPVTLALVSACRREG